MARRYLPHVSWRARLVAVPVALVIACVLVLLGDFLLGWPSDWSTGGPLLGALWLALYCAGLLAFNSSRAAAVEEEWDEWRTK